LRRRSDREDLFLQVGDHLVDGFRSGVKVKTGVDLKAVGERVTSWEEGKDCFELKSDQGRTNEVRG